MKASDLHLAGRLKRHNDAVLTKLAYENAINANEPEWAEFSGSIVAGGPGGYDGYGEYVVVFDSGVDAHAPAIRENFKTGFSAVPSDLGRICYRGGMTDSFFHGTAVAGVILQMLPKVNIISVKVLNQKTGDADLAWWNVGLDKLHLWQERNGIYNVTINISLGADCAAVNADPRSLAEMDRFHDKLSMSINNFGNYVVVAGGNEARIGSPACYPACYTETIGVGSVLVGKLPGQDKFGIRLSDFSNTNQYIDYVALGEDFWTFIPNGAVKDIERMYARELSFGAIKLKKIQYQHKDQWMVELDGSSFGAPMMAAMVCGYVQEYKQGNGGDAPSIDEVRDHFNAYSYKLTDKNGRVWRVPVMFNPDKTGLSRLVNRTGDEWTVPTDMGTQIEEI